MNLDSIFTVTYDAVGRSMLQISERLNIFWQLDGHCEILTGNGTCLLHTDELCVLNPSTPYAQHVLSGTLLHYEINLTLFRTLALESAKKTYCPLAADTEDTRDAKRILAQLHHLSVHEQPEQESLVHALLFYLLRELNLHFSGTILNTGGSEAAERLSQIYQYLTEHFQEKLSLAQIAEHFFISSSYLSRFFHEKTGKSVMQALTEIRLAHACALLTAGDASIESVCYACGFANLHACTDAFRRTYGLTPSEYRKHPPAHSASAKSHALIDYYLHAADTTVLPAAACKYIQSVARLSAGGGRPMPQNHLRYLHCGTAAHLLQRRTQDMLSQMLATAPFRYLYLTQCLDDHMEIYQRGDRGIFFNFDNLDAVCDFVLAHNCLPVLELSYMPRQLAAHPENSTDMQRYVVSMPNSIEDWNTLIHAIILHLVERYGITLAGQFSFALWSLPDNRFAPHALTREELFLLYENTCRQLRSVCPGVRFGLGKLMDTTLENGSWFREFYTQCERANCVPDFLHWGFYAIERSEMQLLATHNIIPGNSINPDALSDSYRLICERLGAKARIEKHITDWNAFFSTSPLNDSIFRALYLIRNAAADYSADTYLHAYCLCDNEFFRNSACPVFSGWNGLFTANGIPKASACAYMLLGKLGDVLLGKGEGYLVTRSGGAYQILLYHYQHFCRSLPVENVFEIGHIDYWDYFDENIKWNVQLTLTDLENVQYNWFEYRLSRESGSAYDYWRSIGEPPVDNEAMREHLCQRSHPDIFTQKVTASGGELKINETLPVLCAKLILLTPVK